MGNFKQLRWGKVSWDEGSRGKTYDEEFGGRILSSWMLLKRLYFFSNSGSFLHFSALGTTREQMQRKSLLVTACHKLHNSFHTPYKDYKRLVVCQFVIKSGTQGDINTIAPSLMFFLFSCK
jgi:hypothetical protein